MSFTSKLSVCFLAAVCAGMLPAQEIFSVAEPADLNHSKRIVKEGDAFLVKGSVIFYSAKNFTLDPAKKYQISGEFCLKAGKPAMVYLGFVPFDGQNRQIMANMVSIVKDTQTEVAEDAKKGDKIIKVKDASKWNVKTPFGYIAFGAKADFSDLPNSDRLSTAKPHARQQGEVWEILLKKPLTKDIAAGTPVRQHQDGSAFMYTGGIKKVTDQWLTMQGTVSGTSAFGLPWNKMWKGTKSVKLMLRLAYGDDTSEVLFRNVKVTEVK